MQKHKGNILRETETLKNQEDVVDMRATVIEMEKAFWGLVSRFDTF